MFTSIVNTHRQPIPVVALGLARLDTTHSTKCPVCGAPVFFYQNDSGSRVFFDSLGDPWPKHPCTDVGSLCQLSPPEAGVSTPPDALLHKKLEGEYVCLALGPEWEDFVVLRCTHMDDETTVIDVIAPYPGKLRLELLALGHVSFVIGSKSKVFRLPGSRLHVLYVVSPESAALFAVRSTSDTHLLHQQV